MAEWLYQIERVNSVTDQQLEEVLRKRGVDGWELVQILPVPAASEPHARECQLVFKAQSRAEPAHPLVKEACCSDSGSS